MNRIHYTPEECALLFDGPNDCICAAACRMSLGGTKMVGARYVAGTAAPGNPGGSQGHVDRSREYCVQEYIFEDLSSPGNTLLFPGHKQGTFDACGRDVVLLAYYKETPTFIGKSVAGARKLLPQLKKTIPQIESVMPKLDGMLNSVGQNRDKTRGNYIVAVLSMNNGHVVSDTDYSWWKAPVSVQRKTKIAQIVSNMYEGRHNFMHYFAGAAPDQDLGYA